MRSTPRLELLRENLHLEEEVLFEIEIDKEALLITDDRIMVYTHDGWVLEFYQSEIKLQTLSTVEGDFLHLIHLDHYDYYFEKLGREGALIINKIDNLVNV